MIPVPALLHLHFNSQPHEEADFRWTDTCQPSGNYFNSQPHEEADEQGKRIAEQTEHFNSQPHEEADVSVLKVHTVYDISTHSLTKRLTFD